MLQQTRVEAVVPYYERFLERFPTVHALAEAAEPDVLAAWSGLGYYSRARNLHRAAKQVAAAGIPASHEEVLALAGAGPYTAAAVSSIALGLPHAAVDGNVLRVISRLANDAGEISAAPTRKRFAIHAEALLDPRRPGDFNQAMMELGATLCTPSAPDCPACPAALFCAARAAGKERELPVKLGKPKARAVVLDLALIADGSRVLLQQRPASASRLAGFWELPEKSGFPALRGRPAAEFSHQIVNDRFRVRVWRGSEAPAPENGKWVEADEIARLPVTTMAKKALSACAAKNDSAQPASRVP